MQSVVEVLTERALGDLFRRSRLVDAITRTSTFMVVLPPTRSNSPPRGRGGVCLQGREISPSSSSSRVPPS